MQFKHFPRFLMIIALVGTLAFTAGCGDDDDGGQAISSFSVTITDQDGNASEWVATSVAAVSGSGTISITAQKGSEKVVLDLGGATTGTYTLVFGSVSLSATTAHFSYLGGTPQAEYNAPTSGSVIVSEVDTENETISGTFSGVVQHPVNGITFTFSGGSFSNVGY